MTRSETFCVAAYLSAIVLANIAVGVWGQIAMPVAAFFLIPLDLVSRDFLHETWERTGRVWAKMALLVATGALLSALFNTVSWRIALGSAVAFAATGVVDTIGFHLLGNYRRFIRVNGSNVGGAITDSIVFPLIAIGVSDVSVLLCLLQAVSKIIGGVGWLWALEDTLDWPQDH